MSSTRRWNSFRARTFRCPTITRWSSPYSRRSRRSSPRPSACSTWISSFEPGDKNGRESNDDSPLSDDGRGNDRELEQKGRRHDILGGPAVRGRNRQGDDG